MIKIIPSRINDLDFIFYINKFIWDNIIPMRESRKNSSLTSVDIPILVKTSYSRLHECCDNNKEGRSIERYQSDAAVIGGSL